MLTVNFENSVAYCKEIHYSSFLVTKLTGGQRPAHGLATFAAVRDMYAISCYEKVVFFP